MADESPRHRRRFGHTFGDVVSAPDRTRRLGLHGQPAISSRRTCSRSAASAAVIGRACSNQKRPSAQAHSTSHGWPKSASTRRPSSANPASRSASRQGFVCLSDGTGIVPEAVVCIFFSEMCFSTIRPVSRSMCSDPARDLTGDDAFAETPRCLNEHVLALRIERIAGE